MSALQRSDVLPAIALLAAFATGCATPGVTAAVHRDPSGLRRILDRPDHGGEDLAVLMSNSISFDCGECVKLLLKAGAKPGADSLSAAVLSKHEAIARVLVDAGADPSAAMAVIHAQTRKWAAGAGIAPEDAQAAGLFFRQLERERAASSDAPPPAAAPAPAPAPAETKPSGAPIEPSFREEKRADDYALVVGVEDYDGLAAAPYARRNAEAAAAFVKALGVPASNLLMLTGVHATRAGLAKSVEGWLPENADAESTVYFYFSGRGAVDPKNGQDCLVPFDGDPRYLEQTGYPLKRLYEKLGGLKVKRVVVILDAGFPEGGGLDAGFNAADGKIALLAAADQGQAAGADPERGYGLFSFFLLDGLDGPARDATGRITLQSAFAYAKANVVGEARRGNRTQVPVLMSGGTATDGLVLRAAAR